MYKEVSFLKIVGGVQAKISLLYDTICNRIIEKWISFPLVKDDSKHVITDRIIYIYGIDGFVKRKIEVETCGLENHNYGSVQTPWETVSSWDRTYKSVKSIPATDIEIKYFRTNSKRWLYKTLHIQSIEDYKNRCYKLKLISLKTQSFYLKYFYSNVDPFQLTSIKKFRKNIFGFFLFGKKVSEKKDNLLNGFKKFENGNQNYLNTNTLEYDYNENKYFDVFVHNEIINEDMFSYEINELLELYKKHST